MHTYTVFVSSSDSYSDIWPVFFDMFRKFWPEFDGVIVLNTEELEYFHPGLNVRCTRVGKLGSFGKTLRAGLSCVPTENVLLLMIDYMFMGPVNAEKLAKYYEFFLSKGLDSLCLIHQGYPNTITSSNSELIYVKPPAPHIMFSYQAAFWRVSMLWEMALPHEDPWMSEWFGSLRAEKMRIKLACLRSCVALPIIYDPKGCLHQGKWLEEAVQYLNGIGYYFQFERRGVYSGGYSTLRYRLRAKFAIIMTGVRGSFWDLLRR